MQEKLPYTQIRKYGLVIQGPMISVGRSGIDAYVPLLKLDNEKYVSFNCSEYIRTYVANNQNINIVLATWNSELVDSLQQELCGSHNFEIISNVDNFVDIPIEGSNKLNNKNRQMYLTLLGAERLREIGVTHIIKVRTDQLINISDLIANFEEGISIRPIKVMVPFGYPYLADHIEDFFFVSSTDMVIEVAKRYLSSPELFQSAHNDYFYAWAYEEFKYIPKAILRLLHCTPLLKARYERCWNSLYCPTSYNIVNEMQWRGERFPAEISASHGAHFFQICHSTRQFVYPELKFRSFSRFLVRLTKSIFRF